MSDRDCPLGEDCDLTLAYMAGSERAKDTIEALRARVAELEGALRFYANLPHEWTVSAGAGLTYGSLHLLGEKARAALTPQGER